MSDQPRPQTDQERTQERISRELYRAIDKMAKAFWGTESAALKYRAITRARDAAGRAHAALIIEADRHAREIAEDLADHILQPEENPSALPGDKDYTPIVHGLGEWLQTKEGSPND